MYSKKDYRFDRIIKSKRATKKYAAVLINRISGRPVKVHFGGVRANGIPYDQYYDSALGLYSKYNHEDKDRKRLWFIRHAKDGFKPYSPSYFSRRYLWN